MTASPADLVLTLVQGNSSLHAGLIDTCAHRPSVLRAARIPRDPEFDASGLDRLLQDAAEGRARTAQPLLFCSSRPADATRLADLARRAGYPAPLRAGVDLPFDIPILYTDPATVGADRILNVIAASLLTQGPAVVVDAGTAVTVDLLTRRGEFGGGMIAPGPEAALRGLLAAAGHLPRIELTRPAQAIGRSSESALQAGLFYSFVEGCRGMVRQLIEELDEEAILPVLVTGGHGELLAAAMPGTTFEPHLTMQGLAHLYRIRFAREIAR